MWDRTEIMTRAHEIRQLFPSLNMSDALRISWSEARQLNSKCKVQVTFSDKPNFTKNELKRVSKRLKAFANA